MAISLSEHVNVAISFAQIPRVEQALPRGYALSSYICDSINDMGDIFVRKAEGAGVGHHLLAHRSLHWGSFHLIPAVTRLHVALREIRLVCKGLCEHAGSVEAHQVFGQDDDGTPEAS